MHELLIAVRRRPGLYLGAENDSFTALCGFMTGYQVGYWAGAKVPANTTDAATAAGACLLPEEFHRFVTEYYGHDYPCGGRGWQHFVREHSGDDQAAFRLFFELLEKYDALQQHK